MDAEGFPGLTLSLRGRTGLTQRELAARVGVHQRSVQDWEAGSSHPGAERLRALIAAFLRAGAFVEGLELAEAEALWSAAQAEAPLLKAPFEAAWFTGLLANRPGASAVEQTVREGIVRGPRRQHWGEAPEATAFWGRAAERERLRRWALDEHCRVVAILGLGGVGKTLLATRLAQDVAPAFDRVYWRSLRNAPAPGEWLSGAIGFLAPDEAPPTGEAAQLERLLELVRQAPCLLVLDNFETVLEPGLRAGDYGLGLESYGTLLRELGETPHRSCLILTSREEPPEVGPRTAEQGPVRVMRLAGLDVDATRALLSDKHLEGDAAAWAALAGQHAGNGLALKVVGEAIREFFGGSIAAYLESVADTQAPVFGSVRQLLDTQIQRLSDVEQGLLLWLAVEREPVTFGELVEDVGRRVGRGLTLEAIERLRRRSMLERGERGATFTLQSVVLEYITEDLVEAIARELARGPPVLLLTQPLLKATARDYVRRTQERLIAAPVLERLVATCGSPPAAEQRLRAVLDQLRERPTAEQGYGPGNLVNLLRLLRGDLRGVDLSGLLIRQAYLQEVEAQDASLSGADLAQSVLAEAFASANCVALSADGAYLAAGTAAGEACVWHLENRRLLMWARGHTGVVLGIALTRDGQRLASGSFDDTVKLWDTSSGRLLATLDVHGGGVWGLALSANGGMAVTGSLDGVVRLWQLPGGRLLATLPGHTAPVCGVALSEDGRLVASASQDGTLRLWEAPTGPLRGTLHGHTGAVYSVALSEDGPLLASGGQDGTIRLWQAASGRWLATLHGHTGPVHGVALNGDGRLVASGSLDGTVRLWEAPTGRLLATVHGQAGSVRGVALSWDGSRVASASPGVEVSVWETGSGRPLASMRGYTAAVTYVALGDDGHLLAGGSFDGTIKLWDTRSGRLLAALQGHASLVYGVALSRDGRLVASGSYDGTIKLWDTPSGRLLASLHGHAGLVYQVALSADGELVASGSMDGTVRLWDVLRGQPLATLEGHTSGVPGVALSADGRRVASGSMDGTVRLWEAPTGRPLATFYPRAGVIYTVALSGDGRLLASGGQDGSVNVWDASSGQFVERLTGHVTAVYGLALSNDGRLLASGSEDGTVKLWRARSGQLLATLSGHAAGVRGVALSRDGRLVASGGFDGTIRLWDAVTGRHLRTLRVDRRYERMDITGLSGVTDAQRAGLVALGAVEAGPPTDNVQGTFRRGHARFGPRPGRTPTL